MVQDYIRSRKALKWAVLARQIGWDRSSFHQWMTGIRRIPAEKLEKLESILINEYGMGKMEVSLDNLDIDKAEELAWKTDYACDAVEDEGNKINKADAGAFFLEGYNYAKHALTKDAGRERRLKDVDPDLAEKLEKHFEILK
jgi:hypothetical protein